MEKDLESSQEADVEERMEKDLQANLGTHPEGRVEGYPGTGLEENPQASVA